MTTAVPSRPPARSRRMVHSRRAMLGALATTALAGCSSGGVAGDADAKLGPVARPKDSGHLRFAIWDKAQEPAMNQIIEAFNRRYPRIAVSMTVTPYGSYFEKLRTQGGGQDLPDVFWINAPHVRLYADYGMLQDLSDLPGYDPAHYPAAMNAIYTIDGTPVAIPKDFDTIALWYNRDLLHRAGVDEPTGSWSWDEYRSASAQVTQRLKKDRIWGNPGGVETQALVYPTIFQAGGRVISPDLTRSGYDDPQTVRAFAFLRGMIADGIAPDVRFTTENPVIDLFSGGRAALMSSGSWQAAVLKDSPLRKQISVAPLMHDRGKKGNVIHGIGTAMSSLSRNKPAAAAFLAFLGSKEANEIQAKAGAANPAYVGTNDAYVDSVPEFKLGTFIEGAKTASPYPASQNTDAWAQLEELMYPRILNGDIGLEDGARELAVQMNTVLAKEKTDGAK